MDSKYKNLYFIHIAIICELQLVRYFKLLYTINITIITIITITITIIITITIYTIKSKTFIEKVKHQFRASTYSHSVSKLGFY